MTQLKEVQPIPSSPSRLAPVIAIIVTPTPTSPPRRATHNKKVGCQKRQDEKRQKKTHGHHLLLLRICGTKVFGMEAFPWLCSFVAATRCGGGGSGQEPFREMGTWNMEQAKIDRGWPFMSIQVARKDASSYSRLCVAVAPCFCFLFMGSFRSSLRSCPFSVY